MRSKFKHRHLSIYSNNAVINYLRAGASRASPCIKALIHANARERVKRLGVHCAWPKEGAILKLWSPYEVGPGILMHFQCITPHITECLRWVHGLVFRTEPVLEMCVVQWLTLVLSDGSNQVGVSLPFSPENGQQIQFPRHILFRIPQCTEFTNPGTLNILLSESFRTVVNITLCSSLQYFHIAGDNIFVFSVKKFSLAYTSTITFIYSVFNFHFNWSQANLTLKSNTSNIFLRIMFI